MIGYAFARNFAKGYLIFKHFTHRNLPGLGKALDLIKTERVLTVKGLYFHFDPRIGRAYGLMIIGEWNEPETHRFLANVLTRMNEKVNFVDVGASIGEFVVDMAACDKIAALVAFEPQPESAYAIEKSCSVNGFQNVRVIQKLITNRKEDLFFLEDKQSPTAMHVVNSLAAESMSTQKVRKISSTTLDDELREVKGKTIILIDIEGEEYSAIQGGLKFIKKQKPLIIFEYNSISRKSFDLNMIRDLLGPDYIIFRIRPDGRVDRNEIDTWNMVAVSKSSVFLDTVSSLRYEG